RRFPFNRGHLFGQLVSIEAWQVDLLHALQSLDLGEPRTEGVTAMKLVRPIRSDDERSLRSKVAHDEREEVPRRAIGPVQVLDREQDGMVFAEARQHRQEAPEQPRLPPPGGPARWGRPAPPREPGARPGDPPGGRLDGPAK